MVTLLKIIAWLCDLLLPDALAFWLARRLAVNDSLPEGGGKDTLIVPAAHGTAGWDRASNGAVAVTNMVAKGIAPQFPFAQIYFGVFASGSYHEHRLEMLYKLKRMPGATFYGEVVSSIEEFLFLMTMLPDGFQPKTLILITDEAHSRRFKIIARTFFPSVDIRVVAIPLWDAIDTKATMKTYRSAWSALVLQAAPIPLYWWWARKGPRYLTTKAKIHQPTSKK